MRINLSDAVDDLAPPPPPCFLNALAWREYLKSAAAVQNNRAEPKVIVIHDSAARFNYGFPYCADCTQIKSHEMHSLGKCKPDHLHKLAQKFTKEDKA